MKKLYSVYLSCGKVCYSYKTPDGVLVANEDVGNNFIEVATRANEGDLVVLMTPDEFKRTSAALKRK